jgi:hypothetical protein
LMAAFDRVIAGHTADRKDVSVFVRFRAPLPASITVSGFREIEPMPSSFSHWAKSGWSWADHKPYARSGAEPGWPVQQRHDGRIAFVEVAGQISRPESRSSSVSWVRSFEPIENRQSTQELVEAAPHSRRRTS